MNNDIKSLESELSRLGVAFKKDRFKEFGKYKVTILVRDGAQWTEDEQHLQDEPEIQDEYNEGMNKEQFEWMKQQFENINKRLDRLEERMDKLEERMDRLEEKLDRHIVEGHKN